MTPLPAPTLLVALQTLSFMDLPTGSTKSTLDGLGHTVLYAVKLQFSVFNLPSWHCCSFRQQADDLGQLLILAH